MAQVVELNAARAPRAIERIEAIACATRMRVVPLCDRMLETDLDPRIADVLAEIRAVVVENMLKIQEQAFLALGRLTAARE